MFTTLIMLFLSASAFSQLGIKAGFALAEPLDDNTSNMHLGFDIGATYDITDNLRAEFLVESLSRKETISLGPFGSMDFKTSFTPITVGGSYVILTDNIQPYAGLNFGLYSVSVKSGNTKSSESYFGLHPKAGISVGITDNIFVDAAVKYHVVFNKGDQGQNGSNTTLFGANIGLVYMLDL